jgi:hypothetical protein
LKGKNTLLLRLNEKILTTFSTAHYGKRKSGTLPHGIKNHILSCGLPAKTAKDHTVSKL